ncbi:hypothetical protein HMPREF1140_1231 [Lachnoanaerobaculum sp. ICM7]|uniref:hypothetical protein n=1 Tax=Lachnoanaerobaculum sp. ICM7 TaxID=936594 RepID=UPI00027A580A|nr:hypothetical protein HMPREF1140_2304 [Lachnoanaerobaculum sp. ICM7]EJP24604.1 hypothetical protein HMPREF1140_1231 [Lachnoanaerobaculum sp. ICM7]
MMKKRRIQIVIVVMSVICIYIMNQIAFFKDREFERAVRDTLIAYRVSMVDRREKALDGIIWKKDLERVQFVSINFREYKVKNIVDIKYFKNTKTVWFSYISAYDGDKSIYEDEHALDNIYIIKKLRYLENLHLYHLEINEDIEDMFPNVNVSIE